MTKEEIEHEKLWVEGIVSAVMLSSKGIVSDFIINLEKVGYKIVKSESENEMLKVEREWISVETPPDKTGNYLISDVSNLFYLVFYHAFSNQWLMANKTVQVKFWHELPQSPKQSCPQCKTEYTKEELLTNEHCFKCGFEMKGF